MIWIIQTTTLTLTGRFLSKKHDVTLIIIYSSFLVCDIFSAFFDLQMIIRIIEERHSDNEPDVLPPSSVYVSIRRIQEQPYASHD